MTNEVAEFKFQKYMQNLMINQYMLLHKEISNIEAKYDMNDPNDWTDDDVMEDALLVFLKTNLAISDTMKEEVALMESNDFVLSDTIKAVCNGVYAGE